MITENFERYQRQICLPEVGIQGQKKLLAARVLIVGCGGLGCPALQYLAAAGVGTIGIIDPDVVDQTNLQRQILFKTEDQGKSKVDQAKKSLLALNPNVKIFCFNERLSVSNVSRVFSQFDYIFDGSDNFGTRYLINDACIEMNKSFVASSVFKFEGQLGVFNLAGPFGARGPSYRCLFPDPPRSIDVPACGDAGVVGTVPGSMGCLQAQEVLKLILGIGTSLSGRLLSINFLSLDFKQIHFSRNEEIISATKILSQSYYDSLNCDVMEKIKYKEYLKIKDQVTLLDVREDAEREEFNIGGLHIPLGQLPKRLAEIPLEKPLVCYCRSGLRSARAIEFLESQGFEIKMYNLDEDINNLQT